jgi:transketolase
MGAAPMAFVLWDQFMRVNPKNPKWFNRDRFVLSAGHGCMLQYALMYLAGYDSVTLDDIKQFRQWDQKPQATPKTLKPMGLKSPQAPWGKALPMLSG